MHEKGEACDKWLIHIDMIWYDSTHSWIRAHNLYLQKFENKIKTHARTQLI